MVMHAIASCLTWFLVNFKFPVTAQSRASSDHFSCSAQPNNHFLVVYYYSLVSFFLGFFFQRVMIWLAHN